MKNSSKSWADIATPNKYKKVIDDWPEIKCQNKSKSEKPHPNSQSISTECTSNQINELTNVMDRLSTQDVEQPPNDGNNSSKSKEEIRAERKVRRKAKQIEKEQKRFEEKLAKIREPKTQKVKIVDRLVMEKYLHDQEICPSERKSKIHSAVKVDLSELINVQMVKPVDRSHIRSRQTMKLTNTTQRHKGKKRENQKKKYVSKLKRSILLSRFLRKQKSNDDNVVVLTTSHCSARESSTKEPNEIPLVEETPEIIPPSSGIKFSRKFRK